MQSRQSIEDDIRQMGEDMVRLRGMALAGGAGGAVASVFSRTGAVTAMLGDYSAFYANIVHAHPSSDITDLTAAVTSILAGLGIGPSAVTSVFGRIGAITAQAGDYSAHYSAVGHTHTFASLTSKPTTLAGYGITDAAASGHTHAYSTLTGLPTLGGAAALNVGTTAGTVAAGDHAHAGVYSAVGHTHSGLAPVGGTAGQVLKKVSGTDYDYSWQADATGGGGGSIGAATVTVPAYSLEHSQTVAAVGVTSGMRIIPSLAPHLVDDENHESMLAVDSMTGTAGTDTITFNLAFGEPASGPVRLHYMAA